MKNGFVAGLLGAALSTIILVMPAEARCSDNGNCRIVQQHIKKVPHHRSVTKHVRTRTYMARRNGGQRMAVTANPNSGRVVSLITSMAPSYGVPTWFALRIAKVESNYNPSARGSAGELGVFQLKCATARGIGYRGNCSGLLDARTNVQFGLKHLALAMKASGGNLQLTASKHNGGLGRKTIVRSYVAQIF